MLRLTRDNAVKDLFLSHLIKKRNKKEISLKTNNNKQMVEKEYLDADVKSLQCSFNNVQWILHTLRKVLLGIFLRLIALKLIAIN